MTSEERKRGLGSLRPDRRRYCDEELLAEVRRVAKVVNKPTLTSVEYRMHGCRSLSVLRRRFGGWPSILERAGVPNPIKYSDEALIAEVRRVAKVVNKPTLTITDFARHGRVNLVTLRRHFGGWQSTLERAGLGSFKLGYYTLSDEALIAEVRRVAELANKPTLTTTDYEEHGRINPSTLRRRFGEWRSVLERAGLGNLCSNWCSTHRKPRKRSNDELTGLMHEVADKDGTLSAEPLLGVTAMGRGVFRQRSGGLKNAPALAGSTKPKRKYKNLYSDEDCFRNIFDVWMHYGRRPVCREMKRPPSRICLGTYEKRWKGWGNAFAAFLEWANSDEAKSLEWGWDKLAGFGRKPDDE